MKTSVIFGLITFLLTLNAHAGSNAILQLRAVVAPEVKVEVNVKNLVPTAKVISNHKGQKHFPLFITQKSPGTYLVSVTHP